MKLVLPEVSSRSVRTIVLLALAVGVLLSALMGGAEGAVEQSKAEFGAGQNDQTSDAISVSGPSDLLVREGTSIGTHLVTYRVIVSPTADLSGVNLVFSIEGADSGKYRIDPMTGELFTAQWIDYETNAIDMFTVVVSGGVHRATLDVTVNIEDVEDSVSTLRVSKANPVPGVYQGNPEHALDDFPHGFVETEWANWNSILRIEVTSESPESDCGTGLDCVRLYVEADGSEDEQELVAIRTGAPGFKFVAAVKLVETEAAGGGTIEVIGADGIVRQVQVLQVDEDDEVEIEFGNLRSSVEVENEPPEIKDFVLGPGRDFDDEEARFVEVEVTFSITDTDSHFPEPEDVPDIDRDGDYMPVVALVHDSHCYNSVEANGTASAVNGLTLRVGTIYCNGQPEFHLIRDDRDLAEIDDGYDVDTILVLDREVATTFFVTFVACDRSGNCIAYDPDEDSDIALVEILTSMPEQDDPCLANITGDSTIDGKWDGTCPSNREPEQYGGSGARFARYYSFALNAAADVSITLTSSEDTYLYLLDGTGKDGPDLYENDDIIPGSNLNSRIEQRLQPGEYTIEATTYYSQKTGEFKLEVSGIGRPPEDADCSSGIAVTDPDDNPGLVSDCEALLGARDTLAGSASLNWSADIPIEGWDGITVSDSHGRVVWLNLGFRNLNGKIPAELGNLEYLHTLDLTSNRLNGEIPAELRNLGKLRILYLQVNQLYGEIPRELSYLSNLTTLALYDNKLSGEIPLELGKLAELHELLLQVNQLEGSIPVELGDLKNLHSLFLGYNDFSGCIPTELRDIEHNDFSELGLLFCDGTDVKPPPPSDPCVVDMGDFESRLEVIDNYWEEQCESRNRPNDGEYHARFFTFNLNEEADVTITLESNPDAYLYLLEGDGQRGYVLFEDDDTEGTNPRIRTTLQAGRYTVEATTYETGVTGDFRIGVETEELDGRPPITCVEPIPRVLSGQTFGLTYYSEGLCRSMNRPDDGDYYADYFRVPLKFPARVTVALESDEDGYLFLLDGEGVTGEVLHENDDTVGTNPQIVADLQPGVYTIEATTYKQGVTGKFRLEIKVISNAGEQCLYGQAVHDPDTNQALFNDCVVLLEAKNILGAEPSLNWSADVPMEEWEGVTLGGSPQRVTGLHFKDRGLKGEIAAELDYLWGLEELDLTGNQLTGGMPHLGNSRSLEFLDLGSNRLSGEVPLSLGGPDNLEVLYLYKNKLRGEIPPELGDLESLTAIALDHNRLSGEIPSELGKLKNLDKVHLTNNRLVGNIPDELADISDLYGLFLSGNALTGCIPDGLRDVEENDFEKLGLPFCVPRDAAHCIEPLPSVHAITIEDSWEFGCISVNSPSDRTYYARYYTLDLSEATPIEIEVTAERAPYVYLLEGEGVHGRVLFGDTGDQGVFRLATTLEAGRYTIEVTTDDNEVTGDFQITVRMLLDAGARCRNGVAVPSPYNNPELVNDCVTLLHTRFWIDVDRRLNWQTDTPIHEWEGLTVDDSTAEVVGIELPERGLRGMIPPELGNLNRLRLLNFRHNELTGKIPREVGNLADLEVLNLTDNAIDGTIPSEILGLSNLTRLQLGGNLIEGQLPDELGDLTALTHLELGINRLTGGIPSELGNLTNLRVLSLALNQLSGGIPPELGRLKNLEVLWLAGCSRLSGRIPSELGDIDSLKVLDVAGNYLTGEIPPELGNLGSLERLGLGSNFLTGNIPVELANLTSLRDLYLYNNNLSGYIPKELSKLQNLKDMQLHRNNLTGEIPPELGDIANLEILYLSFNELEGGIPSELGNLQELRELDLEDNLLTGQIPTSLANLTKLEYIDLRSNQITGCIPFGMKGVVETDPVLPVCSAP